MVLDLIVSPQLARKQPWRLLVAAFFFVTFGVFAHLWLPSVRGSALVFAMIPAIPLFWSLVVREETAEEKVHLRPFMGFNYHRRLIELFAYLFIGSVVAYAFWYSALPPAVANSVFQDQINEIQVLRLNPQSTTTEALTQLSGYVFSPSYFWSLFTHNLNVLFILFALSLVYGMGSIYVLLWNASIIGVFIGMRVQLQGIIGIASSVFGILPHGALEIGDTFWPP